MWQHVVILCERAPRIIPIGLMSVGLQLSCKSMPISTPSQAVGSAAVSSEDVECLQVTGNPIDPQAKLHEIALPQAYEFLEGPTWLASEGTLLFSAWNFSDAPNDKAPPPTTILAKKGDQWSNFGEKGQFGSNGLAISPDGTHIVAALSDVQEVGRIGLSDRKRQPIATEFRGLRFNSPNDLVIRRDGTIYFTDPDYQRGSRSGQGELTGLYRINTRGDVSLVDAARKRPNGLTLSPDEKWLYVGSAEGKIFRYAVQANGDLSAPTVWAEPGYDVDGLSRDCAGNIYASIHTERYLAIYAPSGQQIGKVDVPHKITNVAFGDPDQKTIFITTAGHLYSIRGQLPGHPY